MSGSDAPKPLHERQINTGAGTSKAPEPTIIDRHVFTGLLVFLDAGNPNHCLFCLLVGIVFDVLKSVILNQWQQVSWQESLQQLLEA